MAKKNSILSLAFLILILFAIMFMRWSKEKEIVSVEYDLNNRSIKISNELWGGTIEKGYQYSISSNGEYLLYSKPDKYSATDIYECNLQEDVIVQLTDNDSDIEYDLAVNSGGEYAYISYNRKTAYPQIFVNGLLLENIPQNLYYKKLHFIKDKLIFVGDDLSKGKSCLFIYDYKRQDFNQYDLSIAVYQLQISNYREANKVYLAGINITDGDYSVICMDISDGSSKILYKSDDILYISSSSKTDCIVEEISGNENGVYMFLAYNEIYGSQYLNPFSGTNNFYGRLSWYQSNRLLGLIRLFQITNDKNIKIQIHQVIDDLLSCDNKSLGIEDSDNPAFLWSTKIYGVDTTKPDALLVNQACIIEALLTAVQKDMTDLSESEQIIKKAEEMYKYFERDYNIEEKAYHFRYGGNFYLDGVILPFNQQNIWGIALCHLYEITGDERYKFRVKELASSFKKEFIYTKDGRLFWHYWPQVFYDGWDEDDRISFHTPKRDKSIDFLYEDISHAGINVAFIYEYIQLFGYDIFEKNDISLLSNTLDGIFTEDGQMSQFISGDIKFQPPSRFYYISPYWAYIKSKVFRQYGKHYLNFFEEYDQALLLLYANCMTVQEDPYINVTRMVLDGRKCLVKESNTYYDYHIPEYICSLYAKHGIIFNEGY